MPLRLNGSDKTCGPAAGGPNLQTENQCLRAPNRIERTTGSVFSVSYSGSTGEKVGPVAPGLLRGLLGAPFGHFRVVPTDQHIWHLPATVFRRTRVVRIVQQQPSLV